MTFCNGIRNICPLCEMCMIFTFIFKVSQGRMYANRKTVYVIHDDKVMFSISVIIYDIFATELHMTLSWTLELVKVKCKSQYMFIYDDNSNNCLISRPIESANMTFYLMTIIMFAIYLSLTIYEIFANQIKCQQFDLENKSRSKSKRRKRNLRHSIAPYLILYGSFLSEF